MRTAFNRESKDLTRAVEGERMKPWTERPSAWLLRFHRQNRRSQKWHRLKDRIILTRKGAERVAARFVA